MNPKLNLINIEAVLNPLNLSKAKLCLYKIGIKNIKVSEIVEVKSKSESPIFHNESKFPFNLVSKARINIIASEGDLASIVKTIIKSIKSVDINVCKINTPIMDRPAIIRTRKSLVKGDNYSNN